MSRPPIHFLKLSQFLLKSTAPGFLLCTYVDFSSLYHRTNKNNIVFEHYHLLRRRVVALSCCNPKMSQLILKVWQATNNVKKATSLAFKARMESGITESLFDKCVEDSWVEGKKWRSSGNVHFWGVEVTHELVPYNKMCFKTSLQMNIATWHVLLDHIFSNSCGLFE